MKLTKIIFWVLIILVIYSAGVTRGMIMGMALAPEESCLKMNKTFENEFCILKEGAKYNQEVECDRMKFKIKGEKNLTLAQEILNYPKRILYYPFTGCRLFK